MDSEDKHEIFEKSFKKEPDIAIQQKREKFKDKLINKFNITPNEAEIIINKLKKQNQNNLKEEYLTKTNISKPHMKQQNQIKNENTTQNKNKQQNQIKNENTTQNKNKQQNPKIDAKRNQQSVDEIISNIIPDYKQKISIEVKNVNLTFDITPDKIDTIKESIIRTIKRNKEKKIQFHVLKDINLKIYKGEKVGIIGYNGAGKSTLLNVISGIYPPDTGEVITNGRISSLLSLGSGFDFNYSGRKNIYLNGAVLGYDKELLKKKEKEIIEFSELEEFIDFPIKNYSSGMLAKLGFSIATIVEPDILIIDEILGVGDITFQKKSNDKMKSLMDGKTTVLLVSHSITNIREICDKAIWIDKGKIRAIGEVNEICDKYIKDSEKATREQVANIKFK